jgi:uncharacterized protein involved in exopolysaccharide biosynthesis
VASVVCTALLMRGNTYLASAAIRIAPENDVSEVMGFAQRNWVSPSDQAVAHFNDLTRNILPGGFIDQVLRSAQLRHPISLDPTDRDTRFSELRKSIYAASTSKDVFTIGLVWDDADEAERLVGALQQKYIEDAGLTRQLSTERVTAYLDTEIASVEQRMRRAEQAVIEFKRRNQGFLPSAQASLNMRLQTLEEERSLLLATVEDSSTKRAAVEERLAQVSPTSVLSQTRTAESPFAAELRVLERKRREMVLADAYKSDLAAADAELESLRQKDQDFRLRTGGVAETQYQENPEWRDLQMTLTDLKGDEKARQARLRHLGEQIGILQAQMARFPAAEKQLNEKTREYEVLKDSLKDLLKRREQAQQRAHIAKINATTSLIPMNRIVAEPTMGMKKKLTVIAIALVLGLFLGLLLIVLREWADPTLRYESDAERLLGVPALASLPEERKAA